ncbi:MAG: hypothetical protein FJZ57_03935, partial [Chlamydiae bacterium]|nr:hypothetical protein [Chlamydiota bacterium]
MDVRGNLLRSLPEIKQLSRLESLVASYNHLESLPDLEGLRSLNHMDVSFNHLQSLPNSILNLPTSCDCFLEHSGLSNHVLARLREISEPRGSAGRRFYFSIQDHNPSQPPQNLRASLRALYAKAKIKTFVDMQRTYPIIHDVISNNPQRANSLQSWLSRLTLMQQSERESSASLSRKILSYLTLAETNESFREQFFNTIEGATETCGDRMALSVLHLGVQHRMAVINKGDLKGYAEFLIHGPWMLDRLEEIARAKVETLRFVDEIEVYLGFPTKLRERLNLQIDVEEMLYFTCSGITEADLDYAASFIEDQLSTPDAIANILIQREDWIQALKEKHPGAIAAFQREKEYKLR